MSLALLRPRRSGSPGAGALTTYRCHYGARVAPSGDPAPDDGVLRLFAAVDARDEDTARAVVADRPELTAARRRGASLLRLAAYADMADLVDDLLDRGVDMDVFDAAATGREDVLAELLDLDPSQRDATSDDGFTPLLLASFFGQVKATELLLNRGADCDAASTNPLAVRPVTSAAARSHEVVMHLLLDHGADVDSTMAGGVRPLHAAAHDGRISMVRLLLDRGADPNARTDDGLTPADVARDDEVRALFAAL